MADCHKKPYLNRTHASYDARAVMHKGRDSARVYHCRICNAWHVGSIITHRQRRPPAPPPPYDFEE